MSKVDSPVWEEDNKHWEHNIISAIRKNKSKWENR